MAEEAKSHVALDFPENLQKDSYFPQKNGFSNAKSEAVLKQWVDTCFVREGPHRRVQSGWSFFFLTTKPPENQLSGWFLNESKDMPPNLLSCPELHNLLFTPICWGWPHPTIIPPQRHNHTQTHSGISSFCALSKDWPLHSSSDESCPFRIGPQDCQEFNSVHSENYVMALTLSTASYLEIGSFLKWKCLIGLKSSSPNEVRRVGPSPIWLSSL